MIEVSYYRKINGKKVHFYEKPEVFGFSRIEYLEYYTKSKARMMHGDGATLYRRIQDNTIWVTYLVLGSDNYNYIYLFELNNNLRMNFYSNALDIQKGYEGGSNLQSIMKEIRHYDSLREQQTNGATNE